jgi:hypothetical protein
VPKNLSYDVWVPVEPDSGPRRPNAVRIAVAVVLLLVAGCGTPTSNGVSTNGDATGTWHKLSAPPLSPRQGAITAWTGTEALFLGGDTGPPCPPSADCAAPQARARDGAAFDPEKDGWRRTALAPVPLEPYASHAVIGDEVWVVAEGALLSYDASADAWATHRAPSSLPEYGQVVADGGRVIVVRSERHSSDEPDQVYDTQAQTWSHLPADPLDPAFGRMLTATSVGLVLTGHDLVAQPGSDKPSFVRAALLAPDSDRWKLLTDSDQLGGGQWTWTGKRMVDPTPGGADGGEVNGYGRTIPSGGILDPVMDEWSRLPHPPKDLTGGWGVEALAGPLAAGAGWIYDDRDQTWTTVPRPADGPSRAGSAVWAGEQLIALGGVDDDAGYTIKALSRDAWIYDRST